jgi:hypothetical protein
VAPRFKKPLAKSPPAPVDPWSIQQLYSRNGEGLPPMSNLQQYAKDLTKDQRAAADAKAKQPKMDMLDKASAKFYNLMQAIGGEVVGGIKQDVNALRENPLGSIAMTADAWTVGQPARDRLKQGDVFGAINQSGVGQFAALPQLENIFKGKGSKGDLAWLAATYGTGGLGKIVKPLKNATVKGSTKAYIDILNRLK